jgi:hypothetical protein
LEWPRLPAWWGGGEKWLVRGVAKKPIPLLYPYLGDAPKDYELEWLVPLEKTSGAQTSRGVLGATKLPFAKVLAGLRRREF